MASNINKATVAYDYIETKIIRGEYPPLSIIDEAQLIAELHTSRTPIREAILRLKEMGFVYVYPNRNTLVSELSLDLVNEMYAARFLNEPEMNVLACHHLDVKWLKLLKRQFLSPEQTLEGAAQRDYYNALDTALHEVLLHACPNRFITKALDIVYRHNRRLRCFVSHTVSVPEHVALLEALLAKDATAIRQATLAHLQGSRELTLQAFARGELSFSKPYQIKA